MIIENRTFEPLLQTIPDDTMIFSILNSDDKLSRKIIIENYITFYSQFHKTAGDVSLRFENITNYESIRGLKRIFIPCDYLNEMTSCFEMLCSVLREGFYINMPVSKRAIKRYNCPENVHHHMLIYGVDVVRREFKCMDFFDFHFSHFCVSYDELVLSSELYNNPDSIEQNGVLMFKLDSNAEQAVDYSKVYIELMKMLHGDRLGNSSAYRIAAIEYFIEDIEDAEVNYRFLIRWHETSNYLYQAAKLMKTRFEYVLEDLNYCPSGAQMEIISSLVCTTRRLFFDVFKAYMNLNINAIDKNRLISIARICVDEFRFSVEMFQGLLSDCFMLT